MKPQNFKPILFSTEMVQAILAGRKTQTRRIIKGQPFNALSDIICQIDDFKPGYWGARFKYFGEERYEITDMFKPTAQVGDILWVRETCVRLHEAYLQKLDPDPSSPHFFYWYKAEGEPLHFEHYNQNWKPSIFMSKEAARIFLKVTNVRAERLQDISEEDAIAEGIERYGPFGEFKGDPHPSGGMMRFRAYSKAARAFQDLWDSINAKKHPWSSNPWVWVYEFERVEKPENFLP